MLPEPLPPPRKLVTFSLLGILPQMINPRWNSVKVLPAPQKVSSKAKFPCYSDYLCKSVSSFVCTCSLY